MKKIVLLFFLLTSAVWFSCENEPYEGPFPSAEVLPDDGGSNPSDDDPVNPVEFENQLYALLDGTELLFDAILVEVSNTASSYEVIKVESTFNNHNLLISIPSNLSSGAYHYSENTLQTAPHLYLRYNDNTEPNVFYIGNGSLTVLQHDVDDRHIKAIFESAIHTENDGVLNLTQGSLEIVY
ncbi:hypothetical protein M0G43_11215 [Subsaxibacter sp. CAU 1640]|uniref:hypothetical protein n=1 Tax=Subsaxibacter sp. CAU 1640 TaxID=2933271 RepID=UPI002004E035|nr:hypothetical protein [Subsaxibacter sp. CAU 1640]MCK7591145.1 hypothetical protein [Subsaxibacter sp. CAU 1640]